MADNYLEKRMEDYRSGRLPKARTSRSRTRAALEFPAMRICILGITEATTAVITRLVATGCRVAFTAAAGVDGTKTAQTCGGRFYPCSAAEMMLSLEKEGDAPGALIVASPVEELPACASLIPVISLVERVPGALIISGDPALVAQAVTALIAAPKATGIINLN